MARSYTDLYPRIVAFGNLRRAFRKAARGKRKYPEVAAFEYALESNLVRLESELEEHVYRPGPYRSFTIQDPKQRLISAAPFRDRVVHHALCNVIEPLFECTMIGDSYANRRGKGTHAALDRTQAFARRYRYVLQCDLRQFFPSVDHRILRRVLARKLADASTMKLIDAILASGAGVHEGRYTIAYFPGDDLFAALRPRGLPIGNLTSQFWGNVYLNELISSSAPGRSLEGADVALAKLRFYLRLSRDLDLLGDRRYGHVARQVDEVGRLLGAWRKQQHAAIR